MGGGDNKQIGNCSGWEVRLGGSLWPLFIEVGIITREDNEGVCEEVLNGAQVGLETVSVRRLRGLVAGFTSYSREVDGVVISVANSAWTIRGVGVGLGNWTVVDMTGVHVGLVNNAGEDMTGAQLAIINIAGGDMSVMQLGGLNFAEGNITGVQLGLYNIADGDIVDPTLQGGYNIVDGNMAGVQLGIFGNGAGGNMNGVQLGLCNIAGNMAGVQLGGVGNVTGFDMTTGVRLAIINESGGNMAGVELGFVNLATGNLTGGAQVAIFNQFKECDAAVLYSGFCLHKGE